LDNLLLVMKTSRRRIPLWFLPRQLWMLPKGALRRKAWWSNHHWASRRRLLVHSLWSVKRKRQLLQLFLLRFISHPHPLTT
jgi:hypothetical protein